MKKIVLIALLGWAYAVNAQEVVLTRNGSGADGTELLSRIWKASWISHPSASMLDYGVFLFRRELQLEKVPAQFKVYVSGDNRYKLYVNGEYIVSGPARGDQLNWNYETIDIAPFLSKGKNVIAAEVVNFGVDRPLAQHTYQTAFLLQAADNAADSLNTGKPGWKVTENRAYRPIKIKFETVNGFYAAGPCDSVRAADYTWDWNLSKYNSSRWPDPVISNIAVGKGYIYGNAIHLVPRQIPLAERKKENLSAIVRTNAPAYRPAKISAPLSLKISKHTKSSFLLDNSVLTVGHAVLKISGGKGSKIKITYAEALLDKQGNKGNRNEIEGREIKGYHDVYIADGGKGRSFESLWLRTFRYVQLDIETAGEDLVIDDFYNMFMGYPFQQNAVFTTDNPSLQKIWDISWRTARLCANETYMDCPYYEQLQYIGDTRIQAMISLYVSGDDRLMKNAIKQFAQSITAENITQSRYPSYLPQFIPSFSLMWINMMHDYYMYREDTAFIQSLKQGMTSVLSFFESKLYSNGMVHKAPWWNFTDYADDFPLGIPDGADEGESALISLQYVYALQNAAELFRYLGDTCYANKYAGEAEAVQQAVLKNCYDEHKQMIAETPEKKRFSIHTTVFAILTNTIEESKQAKALQAALSDNSVMTCSIYFRFYLSRAMEKTGLQDMYLDHLGPWYTMLDEGLTTFAESEKDIRSDCHAWSASPMFDFLHTVAGIQPGSPQFKTVVVAPHFGKLTSIQAKVPHPRGMIEVNLKKTETGTVSGNVRLPDGVNGTFMFNNHKMALTGGMDHKISL
ncbi:MAG: family 78 glycoside hydrolase catalytic domain [Chitinophagaceae bacterium]|nr:family 78 glycoside hydrolase catalytic domain [Chitinophagaceae bacterium]